VPLSFVVRSPQAITQWRVAGKLVERSTDEGRTWQTQETGTAAELLAGSSPRPGVAWLVGRNGTVLHTIDGETWQTLDFPDRGVDLVSVSARDADAATVIAASGRTYQTTDRGRTWTLQENPAAPF
jgi:photosystem II stability/assembly factor-like uncharacterized protein